MKKMSYGEISDIVFDPNNYNTYYIVVTTNPGCKECEKLINYLDDYVNKIPADLGPIEFYQLEVDRFPLLGPSIFPAVTAYKSAERCFEGHGLPPKEDMQAVEHSIIHWLKNYK